MDAAGGRLYILAMDHRGSFEKDLFGLTGEVSAADHARISDAKQVIYEGFLAALDQGAPRASAGILVDEEYGAAIARDLKARGLRLAMPVEKSGGDQFELEYGTDYRAHVEAFDPEFTKVLVRYNPEGDWALNARQAARLRELSDWLRSSGHRFLFELLVPPTHEELEAAGGADAYDHALRPALVVRAIGELQAAGVEPTTWKVEGLETREGCRRVVEQARAGGRATVTCIVLGRGADEARVEHWLREGAATSGFVGFAIGRTIWSEALRGMLAGTHSRDAAAAQVAARYLRAISVYESGLVSP